MSGWNFDEKPVLVFWETTKACRLACRHCRAEAITSALPNQLSNSQSMDLIDQVTEFGKPTPVLVLTGGDPLMRDDIWSLVEYSRAKGVRVGLAPAVSDKLDEEALKKIKDSGIASVSISLDSSDAQVHDSIRGVDGTFKKTIEVLRSLRKKGVRLQVNTTVMRQSIDSLPDIASLLVELGVPVWEVFFLVETGRASPESGLSPAEWEDVSFFLYQASKYGLTVRTVEGPMFRRAVLASKAIESADLDPQSELGLGETYRNLSSRLSEMMDSTMGEPQAQIGRTRDGNGIVFVSHNGTVCPSGFLAHSVGNVRTQRLPDIYRNSEELVSIRNTEFKGRCGKCEFRTICGGSRARAYTRYGDILGEDPACPYLPGTYDVILHKLGHQSTDAYLKENDKHK